MGCRVQKLVFSGLSTCKWVDTTLEDLKVGDRFRMLRFVDYKNEYEYYTDEIGRMEWIVKSEPYIHPKYGTWTINVEGDLQLCSTWIKRNGKESGIICYYDMCDNCMIRQETEGR